MLVEVYMWSNTVQEFLVLRSGGPVTEVVLLVRWSYYRGGPITEVVLLLRWFYY